MVMCVYDCGREGWVGGGAYVYVLAGGRGEWVGGWVGKGGTDEWVGVNV